MTSYSINLEDVELALLPLYSHTNTYNNFLKKEHYRFEVMKEETVEETSVSSILTYTCHICAVEVPAAFAREHAASVKHRAGARIASVAAQRMRRLVAALPPPVANLPNTRFCANCNHVVDGDHDKTKEHRVAVMHDNLLWELTKAYVGDDEGHLDDKKRGRGSIDLKNDSEIRNSDRKNINAVVQSTTDNNLQIIDTGSTDNKCVQDGLIAEGPNINDTKQDNPKDKETKEGSDNINNNEDTQNVIHSTSRWVKVPITKVEKKTQNEPAISVGNQSKAKHKDYEKELRKFMDADNPFEIKELYNRIQLKINDITMDVYTDHFHSYHRMYNNGKIECILCDSTFNYKDAETHKYDLNHMTNVAKIGMNGEFVRKINDFYSHCILCNQKVKNPNLATHTQSQYHVTRKSNNTRTNTAKPKIEAAAEKKTETVDKDTVAKSNSNVIDQIEYPYEDVPGKYDVRCVICNCDVPRNVRNREDHAKGFRHISNMK